MKTFMGFGIWLSVLLGFALQAEAINITLAEVQNSLAIIEGNKAAKNAIITWENANVTKTTSGGAFSFSGIVPVDCVGTLSDGVSTIDVALGNCPPVSQALVPVPQTGQTTSYAAGDDGAIRAGVVLPTPRFTDNGDGTVSDNATELIWLKNGNCFGLRTWTQALSLVNNLANGQCGLTDSSSAGDWRVPNIRELLSLVDFGRSSPALPSDHLFTDFVGNSAYWSSTTSANDADSAWSVDFTRGNTFIAGKSELTIGDFIIPVRGP